MKLDYCFTLTSIPVQLSKGDNKKKSSKTYVDLVTSFCNLFGFTILQHDVGVDYNVEADLYGLGIFYQTVTFDIHRFCTPSELKLMATALMAFANYHSFKISNEEVRPVMESDDYK